MSDIVSVMLYVRLCTCDITSVILCVQNTMLLCRLAKLNRLTELDLCSNNFSQGLPGVVGQLRNLKVLKLDWCHLTGLPEQ